MEWEPQARSMLDAMAVDAAQMVSLLSIALTLKRDARLRAEIFNPAGSSDAPVILGMPCGGGTILFDSDRRLTCDGAAGAAVSRPWSRAVSDAVEASPAYASAEADAVGLAGSVTTIGIVPDRTQFSELLQWAPLLETLAYRVLSRCVGLLDVIRPTALDGPRRSVPHMLRYQRVAHLLGPLALLTCRQTAAPWLVQMSRSVEWQVWTPTIPFLRERSGWLAACGARSAAAFGEDVVERYLMRLRDDRHFFRRFDKIFGLCAIGSSDIRIASKVLKELNNARRTIIAAEGDLDHHLTATFDSAADVLLTTVSGNHPLAGVSSERLMISRKSIMTDPTDFGLSGIFAGFALINAATSFPLEQFFPADNRKSAALPVDAGSARLLMTRSWKSMD